MSGGRFVVIGAGGHAKVVIATIESSGGRVVGLFDDAVSLRGTHVLGHRVEGPLSDAVIPEGVRAIIAVGSNRKRLEIAGRLAGRLHVEYGVAIHPSAIVHGSAVIGPGSVVFAGAIVQPDVRVGAHAILNTGASIDHDSVVSNYAHVAPGARLAGDVLVGEGALMGIGSCAVPGVRIGAWAVVGAGAVVVRSIAAGATAIGIPARTSLRS